jgi:hypothetical protein
MDKSLPIKNNTTSIYQIINSGSKKMKTRRCKTISLYRLDSKVSQKKLISIHKANQNKFTNSFSEMKYKSNHSLLNHSRMKRLRESEQKAEFEFLGHQISNTVDTADHQDHHISTSTAEPKTKVNKNIDYFKEYLKQTEFEVQSVPDETHSQNKNEDLEPNTTGASYRAESNKKLLIRSTIKRIR